MANDPVKLLSHDTNTRIVSLGTKTFSCNQSVETVVTPPLGFSYGGQNKRSTLTEDWVRDQKRVQHRGAAWGCREGGLRWWTKLNGAKRSDVVQ